MQAYNNVCEFKKSKYFIFNPKLIDLNMGRSIRNLRTELVTVAIVWDDLYLGVKGQPRLVIAGSPRKLFK